ncbi:hypothetical protein [Synechococcus sp. BA-132 BA5]|uniref:hypothetical protein n=1 Tax=Synechococcus sp. BA-132 BA5 TaxID=3110252 RepID=UPI002B1F117D|nr:hypothetical protein [Synechococcus sp. BA-132 BA5]MEA5413741.1 hypothetical protein [Synechococcus sp. BA-132 BA5]
MADTREQSSPGGLVLLAAAAGAVAGAAGLAVWLLRRAERRHLVQRQLRMLRVSRLAESSGEPVGRDQLHDRVQKLNQAIDEVRRQLEQLQPQP